MRMRLGAILLYTFAAAPGAALIAAAAPLATTPTPLLAGTIVATVPVSTCTLASEADTYADGAAPLSALGSATALHVRSQVLFNKRTYVRFNIASCSIPSNARLKTSDFKLVVTTAPGSSRTYDVHRVTAAWTEAALTSLAQPAVAAIATASFATGTSAGVTLTSDVLTDVGAFVTGSVTNNGWRVKDRTEDAVTAVESQFGSRENATIAQRPSLVITYYP